MLNLNKSNVICNEIIKLCTHISLSSDKKKKKSFVSEKKCKGKKISRFEQKSVVFSCICNEIVEKHVALEKKC